MPNAGGAPPRKRRGRPVGSDSAETRRRILRAARQVITERGYQAATFQAIALTAGLSRPSLHHYFDTREDIYQSLLAESSAMLADCIALARQHHTLVDRLTALIDAIDDADSRDRSTMAFAVSARLEASRDPELAPSDDADLRAFLRDAVAEGARRGEISADVPQEALVDTVDSILWGIGFHTGFVTAAVDKSAVAKQLVRVLSGGLLSPVAAAACGARHVARHAEGCR